MKAKMAKVVWNISLSLEFNSTAIWNFIFVHICFALKFMDSVIQNWLLNNAINLDCTILTFDSSVKFLKDKNWTD